MGCYRAAESLSEKIVSGEVVWSDVCFYETALNTVLKKSPGEPRMEVKRLGSDFSNPGNE